MKSKNSISESDLLIYCLAVDKKYYELLELYAMFIAYSTCKKCGHDNRIHFRLIREIINSFGAIKGGIKVPNEKELGLVSRDITIWKGMQRCEGSDNPMAVRAEEYAARYEITVDGVYKIRDRMQKMVDKFMEVKRILKKRNRSGKNR